MPTRHAFTLIEILVVVGILALLMAPLSAVVRLAQKSGQKTQAQALLRKVDAAVRLFRDDVGTLPWQDHAAGVLEANDLGWRLAHTADDAERIALRSDLAAVTAAYASGGGHTFAIADVDPREAVHPGNSNRRMHVVALNRLGAERGRLAVLSGNTAVYGVGSHAGSALITQPAASAGWCDDYLGAELGVRDRSADGRTIRDAWDEPIRYICPVVPGVRGFWPTLAVEERDPFNFATVPILVDYYGLGTTSRRSATTSLDSDRTSSAAARMIAEPELWSAGEDRLISVRRNAPGRRDDIPARPYDKELR